MRIAGSARVHLGIGLFVDGRDDDIKSVGARRIEEQEREAAVAGNEAEFVGGLEEDGSACCS